MRAAFSIALILALATAPFARADDFPYETKTGTELGLLATAGALYGAGWWLDRHFEPLDLLEVRSKLRDDVLIGDRFATGLWSPRANEASDWLVHLQIAAPASLTFGGGGSRQPDRVALMYGETMALTTGMTWLLKNAFDRTRPFVYNDDPSIPVDLKQERTARKSFSSGHTANAFASMVFLAQVFETANPDSKHHDLVWAGCLTSASLTGILRIAAGRHFPTDVLVGAAIGSLAGWAVPHLHEIDEWNPAPRGEKRALSIAWRFGF